MVGYIGKVLQLLCGDFTFIAVLAGRFVCQRVGSDGESGGQQVAVRIRLVHGVVRTQYLFVGYLFGEGIQTFQLLGCVGVTGDGVEVEVAMQSQTHGFFFDTYS